MLLWGSMEDKVIKQGVVIFSALTGLLQAVAQGAVGMQDVVFIMLVTAFFVALEHDYHKYKQRIERENKNPVLSPGESKPTSYPSRCADPLPRLKYYPRRVLGFFKSAGTFLFFPALIILDKYGISLSRYRIFCGSKGTPFGA